MGASDRRVCLSHQNWKEKKKSASIHYSSLLLSVHRNFGSFVGQNGSTEGLTPFLDVHRMGAAKTRRSGCFHIQSSEQVAAVQAECSTAS